ncbi:hypothetical protein LUZ60_007933 [Juncus effusus]|nr:hypothetical protein LUZ60_007933 [Juncus effusus]
MNKEDQVHAKSSLFFTIFVLFPTFKAIFGHLLISSSICYSFPFTSYKFISTSNSHTTHPHTHNQERVEKKRNLEREREREIMSDWGPVFISVVLFILLTPGLLFQLPGKGRIIEFANFQTSGVSILVHAIIYFALIAIFLLAVGVHVYLG